MSDAHRRYRAIQRTLAQALPSPKNSHRARAVQTLSALICGIVGAQHTQLPQIARKSPRFGAKPASRVKQFQRWVLNERVDQATFFLPFAQALLQALAHLPLVLMMDGSTVGRGCLVLMLRVRYRGRALPLAWTVIRGKKGHFPAATHCALVDQVVPMLPPTASVVFLGDGEFDRLELQRHLHQVGWNYVCRTACNTLIWWGGDLMLPLQQLFVPQGESLAVLGAEVTAARYGPVLIQVVWEHGYDHARYLVSNLDDAASALRWYRLRAHIETFCSDQKSRGFRLDRSHLSDPARLQRLLIAACLAYLWLMYLGSRALAEKLAAQIHRPNRCDLSLFQLGASLLDWLMDATGPLPVAFCPVPTLALAD